MRVEYVCRHSLDGVDIEHVGVTVNADCGRGAIQLCRELLGVVGRAVVMNRDVRAGTVQRARDDGADAFRGARDERPTPVERSVSFGPGHQCSSIRCFVVKVTLSTHAHDFPDDDQSGAARPK